VVQCGAVWCSVVQRVIVRLSDLTNHSPRGICNVLQYVAVCCSVLQCVAVWCSVVRCGAVGHDAAVGFCKPLSQWYVQRVVVRCSMLQRASVCCIVVHCGAVHAVYGAVWCSEL